METTKKHGLVARIFHWGFILVFIYALFKQLDNIDQLSEPGLLRFEVVFAAAFLVLLAARYTYMRVTMPSALPEETSVWMKRAARAGHLAMYISLSMIAISGLLIGALYYMGGPDAAGMGIAVFLHENAVLAAYASIALHVAAALFHRLKGDGIWSSMVPVMTEEKAQAE